MFRGVLMKKERSKRERVLTLYKFPLLYHSIKGRDFLLLLQTIIVSNLGRAIQSIAVTWYILSVFGGAKSGLYLAFYYSCFLIPLIMFGPIAGMFVDMHNRKNIIIITNVLRGVFLLILAGVTFLKFFPMLFLFLITIINAILIAFSVPAANACIPNIVKDKNLVKANSVISLNENLTFIIGASIAGFLYAKIGIVGVFTINGVLFVLTGVFVVFTNNYKVNKFLRERKVGVFSGRGLEFLKHFKNIFSSIKDGFVFIKSDRPIYLIIIFGLVINFFIYPFDSILLPKTIKFSLHLGASKYGIMQAIASVGGVLGLGLMTIIPKKNSVIYNFLKYGVFVLGVTVFLSGILLLPIGFKYLSAYGIYVIFCFLGFIRQVFDSLFMIPMKTIYQKRVPNEYRGRFYGFMNTMWIGLQPVSCGILGLVTSLNYFSTTSIMIALGVMIVIMSILIGITSDIKKLYLQINFG